MQFTEAGVAGFLANFEEVKDKIRGFEGCEYLELWQDKQAPNTFFTYSQWLDESYLNQYRQSNLFKETWAFTKARFAAKAQAWSVDVLHKLP